MISYYNRLVVHFPMDIYSVIKNVQPGSIILDSNEIDSLQRAMNKHSINSIITNYKTD